jgi:type II secretory pathway predicted ATPase ExeA
MYEAFYGLQEKPFSLLPDPHLIYWGHNHRLAFAMLEFGVVNCAGFTVITGEIGSGKTTLIRYLLSRLDPETAVGLISNTPRGTDGLLAWVMMSFNKPYEGSYPTLFRNFQQFLYQEHKKGRRVILIIDEAQNLGLETLEELRMLSNVNADKDQFLQIILVGQPQLRDMLRTPQLVQFAQRVSSDFHLQALDAEEVLRYINYRVSAVGSRTRLFSDQACIRIAKASRGIPRTINVLCDTALVYGFAMNKQVITPDIVDSVIEKKNQFGVLPIAVPGD